MRITFAVHPTGHTQVWLNRQYLLVLTLPSASNAGVKLMTSGNLLLSGIKQEMQADGMYVENIFSSKLVTQLIYLRFSHPNASY